MNGMIGQILFQGWEPLLRTAIGTTITERRPRAAQASFFRKIFSIALPLASSSISLSK
jgi:hypothetical protein